MEVEFYIVDQFVLMGEFFCVMQCGMIDVVQLDDDFMVFLIEVIVFGGYFLFVLCYFFDVLVLFNQYGLKEIWEEEYVKVGVKYIFVGVWDFCYFVIKDLIWLLVDLQGKWVFIFLIVGWFMSQFGVVLVMLLWEDIEVVVQIGEFDGIVWFGIIEDYMVGWVDVINYFLINNIFGVWVGLFFVNQECWNELLDYLKIMLQLVMDVFYYYCQWWYWGGEVNLCVNGIKMELIFILDEEWVMVEVVVMVFWDEIVVEFLIKVKVVEIFKKYNQDMQKVGCLYCYS